MLTNVRLQFVFDEIAPAEGNPINRVYPSESFDLFAGEQLVLVGRYRKAGAAKVAVEGMVGERRQAFDFPAALVDKSHDESFAFIEKLWAVRRIGEIIDELDLKGQNEELVKELVELATRHGILTPYTSFMADDGVNLRDVRGNAAIAGRRLEALGESSGAGGFAQRRMKGAMQNAQQAPVAPGPGMMDGFGALPDSAPLAGARRESEQAAQNIRNIGNRAFYRRDGQWVDSQVTENRRPPPEYQTVQRQYSNCRNPRPPVLAIHGLRRAGAAEHRRSSVFDRAITPDAISRNNRIPG